MRAFRRAWRNASRLADNNPAGLRPAAVVVFGEGRQALPERKISTS